MKKFICALLSLAVIITCIGCSAKANDTEDTTTETDTAEPEKEFDEATYKSLVAECNESIVGSSLLLSNIAQWEYSYWKSLDSLGGTMKYDELFSKGEEWLAEESAKDEEHEDYQIGTISTDYEAICDKYKEITNIDIAGSGAEEISKQFQSLFSSYNQLYLIVTAPSGDLSSFADNYNNYSSAIKENNSTLSVLVG